MATLTAPGYRAMASRYGNIRLDASASTPDPPSAKRIAKAERRIAALVISEASKLGLTVGEVEVSLPVPSKSRKRLDDDIPF